jgi:translation elongation factor P/translation initiation factor 5A
MIFYCPDGDQAAWYFMDSRTYRTGRVSEDYLISELEQLL